MTPDFYHGAVVMFKFFLLIIWIVLLGFSGYMYGWGGFILFLLSGIIFGLISTNDRSQLDNIPTP
jgi:hypothetical protein